MGRTYLIDGYNLMHQAPPFSDPSSGSLEERREGLLLRLATYAAIRGTRLQVVFDGPRSASGRSAHPGLSVRFVPAPADNYLRGVIARRQGDRSLVVVTSDRKDIGGYAQASGIEWMTSPDFWAWISRPPRLKGSPDTPDEDASRPSGWTSQDDDDLLKAFGEDGGDDK